VIALFRRYLRPYVVPLVAVLILLLVQAIGNLYLPDLNADIINNGIARGDNDHILRTGALMLVVTGLLGVTAVIAVYWGARVAMGFGRDVRSAIFSKVESFSQVEVNHFGPASLITRNTNDVQQVQTVVFVGLTVMISAPILIVGGIIMALRTDVPLSGLLVVVLPLMAIVIGLVMRILVPLFRAMQAKLDRINQVMREKLAGIRVIRAFVRTEHEERRFDGANRDLFATTLRVNRIFALVFPTMMAIFNLSSVAVIWFGAARVSDGALPIGNLTAFLQYLMQILFAVLTATFMFILLPRGAVSAGRILDVLEMEPTIRDPDEPVVPSDPLQRGVVEFRDVEFRYPGAEDPVLRGISFRAAPGETTAIVGSTGSGKSTLINLIPRFYDATTGSVMVDGVDVRDRDRADLWARIGLVPQKAFLFAGTVASNLRFGNADATEEELWHALEIAQAKDFVEEMEGRLDAPITQGGSNVSGGQRQRLAIARAIYRNPPILIFDEATSALDSESETLVQQAIARLMENRTVVVIAHRLSTVLHADRIVVIDGGRVVEQGTHTELLSREGRYSQLYELQFAEMPA
jgi:ATP-binding cassette subfamily B protein